MIEETFFFEDVLAEVGSVEALVDGSMVGVDAVDVDLDDVPLLLRLLSRGLETYLLAEVDPARSW